MSLRRIWSRRGPLAWLLWPLSVIYALLSAIHRASYRLNLKPVSRFAVPVIVVGNVVAGGSGKTPAVISIVQHLLARGRRVGVVSRGYGRSTDDCREVDARSTAREVGDEPKLIQRKTGAPVYVARNRPEAVAALLRRHPAIDCIVCDDGLQHLALARDIEVCAFDDSGVGNGFLLPAGPLRERWPRPCDMVLHTGAHPAFEGFRAHRALADHAVGADGTTVPFSGLAGRRLVALAAIARPEAFFDMLEAKGLLLDQRIALPDHADLDAWVPSPDLSDTLLLCTEKDAVKLWPSRPDALAVPLLFEPENAFFDVLYSKLSSVDGHQAA